MRFRFVSAALCWCVAETAAAQTVQASAPIKCEAGPVTYDLGGSAWLGFACDDGKSLILLSDQARGNPVAFYFLFFPKEDGSYGLSGEGNGDREVTRPVFDILKSWEPLRIAEEYRLAVTAGARGGAPVAAEN